jgi:hypothetical protein
VFRQLLAKVSPLEFGKPRGNFPTVHYSVGAGVRPSVWRVIRAAVAVIAATEIMPSIAIEITMSSAKVTSGKVTSAETAAAVSTTPVSAAVPTAAARLRSTRRKHGPGKQGRCQYHHHSS